MDRIKFFKDDLSNLLIQLEDSIERFYSLHILDDDDMLEVLGLQFTYCSLLSYLKKKGVCNEKESKDVQV